MTAESDNEEIDGLLRFRCVLTNLKVEGRMNIKGFVIEPIEEAQEDLNKASGMETIPIYSAILTAELPLADDASEGKNQLKELGFEVLKLLLAFTSRTQVQSVNECFERLEGGSWKSIGGGKRDFPVLGTVRGEQMQGLTGGVEGFVERNLERIAADEKSDEKGIALAMRFLCSNYTQDFIESKYVKTWTALEILGAKNCQSLSIFTDDDLYDLLRSRLRTELRTLVRDETITAEQRDMLYEKLVDSNRKAISRQIVEVTECAFSTHPELIPKRKEVIEFAGVRNKIAHEGSVPDGSELPLARMQLHALVERLLVSLLDEEAEMLDVDWRNHRYQV